VQPTTKPASAPQAQVQAEPASPSQTAQAPAPTENPAAPKPQEVSAEQAPAEHAQATQTAPEQTPQPQPATLATAQAPAAKARQEAVPAKIPVQTNTPQPIVELRFGLRASSSSSTVLRRQSDLLPKQNQLNSSSNPDSIGTVKNLSGGSVRSVDYYYKSDQPLNQARLSKTVSTQIKPPETLRGVRFGKLLVSSKENNVETLALVEIKAGTSVLNIPKELESSNIDGLPNNFNSFQSYLESGYSLSIKHIMELLYLNSEKKVPKVIGSVIQVKHSFNQ
jgi:hypothetical protein